LKALALRLDLVALRAVAPVALRLKGFDARSAQHLSRSLEDSVSMEQRVELPRMSAQIALRGIFRIAVLAAPLAGEILRQGACGQKHRYRCDCGGQSICQFIHCGPPKSDALNCFQTHSQKKSALQPLEKFS